MKHFITLLFSIVLLSITSCNNEQQTCNCQVIGNDQIRTVRMIDSIQIIQSSHPAEIIPYDTITDCNQDQVSWYDIVETPVLNGVTTRTSYRKIQCN